VPEIRTAYSFVKERNAARPEQRGTDAPSSGAKGCPRLTLIHFARAVYCGNYVERKVLKSCDLWQVDDPRATLPRDFVRLRYWS
jgi:hypothetical protein